MTYKQIETSREIRLWITGIVGPIIIGGATILAGSPELRVSVKNGIKAKMNAISKKFKKKEEK